MATNLGRLLIVDDEADFMSSLRDDLTALGYEAHGFTSAPAALGALQQMDYDVLLTDLVMPEMDGLALLRAALEMDAYLIGIVMAGYGTVQTATDAMKVGAFDYVLKPFKPDAILPVLTRATQMRRLHLENVRLRETVAIHELSRAIAFSLDLSTVLNKVVQAAAQLSQADNVSMLLPSAGGDELYVAAAVGAEAEARLGLGLSSEEGTAGWVARLDAPVVRDASVWVPVLTGGKLQGVLRVDDRRRPRPFALDEVKSLNILTGIVAPAIENARLHAQVREAEEKYRSVFENTVEGIFQLAPDGHYRLANPALARMLGYASPEDLLASDSGHLAALCADPDVRADFNRLLEAPGPIERFEFRANRYNSDEMIWLSVNLRAMRDADHRLICYEGTLEDVTERKQAEEATKEERNLLRTLIDALPDHIYVKDAESHFLLVNEAQAKDFDLHCADEAIGKTDWELGLAECAADYRQTEQAVVQLGVTVSLEEHYVMPSQQRRVYSTVKAPLRDTKGDVIGLVGVSRDITERKQLEAQMLQAQKMETVGRLAGGVAHDFNNLLTVIGGYAGLVKAALPADSHTSADIDQVIRAGERAAQLTRQLLTFSRRQVVAPVVIDLNQLILETDKMLRRLIGEHIELVTVPDPDLGAVKVDPGQIEQVLVNLAVNARDAMPEGGRLTVETGNVTLGEDYVRQHVGAVAGPYVLLAVSDTGTGMTEEVQARMFEPFFTTKEVGKGTGLGLATVYGIVQQHQGSIHATSEPGRGTTFKIYLPRVEETVQGREPRVETGWLPRGDETVLVVEDEPAVRQFGVQSLMERGYTVLEAGSGDEALEVFSHYTGKIDLLVSDVIMPRMNGKELATRLQAISADLVVLYTSGYTDNAIIHQGVLDAGVAFLQKPFTAIALAQKVHQVLHGEGASASASRRPED